MEWVRAKQPSFRSSILGVMIAATLLCFALAIWFPATVSSGFKKGRSGPVFSQELNDTGKIPIISFVYRERKAQYDAVVESLDLNFKLHAVLILIALIVLFRGEEKIKIPLLDIEISTGWMYIFVPLVLAYLWLQFGFLLDEAIDTRIALKEIVLGMELQSVNSFYTVVNALEDRGFLDIWFVVHHGWGFKTSLGSNLITVLLLAYGVFYGLAHACMISVAYAGFVRGSGRTTGYGLMILGLLALTTASHMSFYWIGVHRNWFQPAVAIAAIVATYVFTLQRFAPTKLNPADLRETERENS